MWQESQSSNRAPTDSQAPRCKRLITSRAHCSRGTAVMSRAILTTGLRSFSFRAQMRHSGLSSRKILRAVLSCTLRILASRPLRAHFKQTASRERKHLCEAPVARESVACYEDIAGEFGRFGAQRGALGRATWRRAACAIDRGLRSRIKHRIKQLAR